MTNAGDRLTFFATKPSFLWLYTTTTFLKRLTLSFSLNVIPGLKVVLLPSGGQKGDGEGGCI